MSLSCHRPRATDPNHFQDSVRNIYYLNDYRIPIVLSALARHYLLYNTLINGLGVWPCVDSEPLVSVVITTHNRQDKLMRLIGSIRATKYPRERIEIIVVDDASTDGTIDRLKRDAPGVLVVRNDLELLLAASRNIGIIRSTGELIFLIDDDNMLDPDCIPRLVATLSDPSSNMGVVSPVALYLSAPTTVWWKGTARNMVTSKTSLLGRGEEYDPDEGMVKTADCINAFMVRREIFEEVGLFDSSTFPIHYDEADFGERVRRAGYEMFVDMKCRTWHDIPPPDVEEDRSRAYHCQNEMRAYYCARNRVIFHARYSRPAEWLSFFMIFNWAISGAYLEVLLTDRKNSIGKRISLSRSYLRGVVDGWKALVGA